MDVVSYEMDKGFILKNLREGEFDYVETGSEVFEEDFFHYIRAKKYLHELSRSYPSPRVKEEVPRWLFLAGNLAMRLHGVNAYNQFSYVIRCGGMLNAFGPELGKKAVEPETQNITLCCPGFNDKNDYPRETPCHPDFLRKYAADTEAANLLKWHNEDAAKLWKTHKVYDRAGIFIGDGSYLFVPDNPNYEGSVKLLFDKNNHPVDPKKITKEQIKAGEYQYRRCYKMILLLHTNRSSDFFIAAAVDVVPGNRHECPIFFEMLNKFVNAVGVGVVKRLILDRGFIDGKNISRIKQDYGIDTLIPLKKDMDIFTDAMGLVNEVKFERYEKPSPASSEPVREKSVKIQKREAARMKTLQEKAESKPPLPADKVKVTEEVGVLHGFESWESCPIPLSIIYCRDSYADGSRDDWILVDTQEAPNPGQSRTEYRQRVQIEERYRQLKCFSDLSEFTSRKFSLVVSQVVFILLTYTLLQIYLLRTEKRREKLSNQPMPQIRKKLRTTEKYVIVYRQNRFCFFRQYEFMEILLTLEETPRKKALKRTRDLRSEMDELLEKPPPFC